MKSAFRDDMKRLRQNGITTVAFSRLNDPSVIPLWFGEGDSVTPHFIREAAKSALDDGRSGEVVRGLREQYRAGRAIVDSALAGHPLIEHRSPAGAFYAFPRIRGLDDSLSFAQDILREEDLGIAPGYTFGDGFDNHIRLSFAQSHQKLAEGLRRLVRFVERRFGDAH